MLLLHSWGSVIGVVFSVFQVAVVGYVWLSFESEIVRGEIARNVRATKGMFANHKKVIDIKKLRELSKDTAARRVEKKKRAAE